MLSGMKVTQEGAKEAGACLVISSKMRMKDEPQRNSLDNVECAKSVTW